MKNKSLAILLLFLWFPVAYLICMFAWNNFLFFLIILAVGIVVIVLTAWKLNRKKDEKLKAGILGSMIAIVVIILSIGIINGYTKETTKESSQDLYYYDDEVTDYGEESEVLGETEGTVKVKSHQANYSSGSHVIVGEVVNKTNQPVTFVKVTATFYNKNKKVVGTDFTYAGDTADTPLKPKKTTPFEIYCPENTDFTTYKLDVTWD